MEQEQTKDDLPYSYHTFIYVFTYEKDIKDESRFQNTWELKPYLEEEFFGITEEEIKKIVDSNQRRWDYATFNYFSPKARVGIFNTRDTDTISKHYQYRKEKNCEYTYVIITSDKTYKLRMNGIGLSIYPRVKIGILSFELEYDANRTSGDEKKCFEDFCAINDAGRRLFYSTLEYKGDRDGKVTLESFVPVKQIKILKDVQEEPLCEVDFGGQAVAYFQENKERQKKKKEEKQGGVFDVSSNLILNILGKEVQEQIGDIKSVFDDRMFTLSLMRDDYISNLLKTREDDIPLYRRHDAKIFGDMNMSQAIYAAIFCNPDANNCSCQNAQMRDVLFDRHLYDRWSDYGTIYGVTEYSMICLTGEEDIVDSVINPFLIEYLAMIKLALVQRGAINSMETDMVGVCKGISDNKKEVPVDQIKELWKKYVVFQNELYLPEVTFQEQGVEIYDYLKESLKITKLHSRISEELDNLQELAVFEQAEMEKERDQKLNSALNFIAVLAIMSAVSDGFVAIELVARLLLRLECVRSIREWYIGIYPAAETWNETAVVQGVLLLIVLIGVYKFGKSIFQNTHRKEKK